ncbi:uncharacterized protein BDZ99DRAFT_459840 [Mytilinidion resinicola]|uniref:AMMECR1 domain-containing protein n=1 Tax=Mytilinidion resinicola TaxID=574789 RepID=A0A6A6YYW1_9PEZI|nr:uncharacterized protein BDZ99DRAFT_459840 [Mytilinidion resinicola]KAF2814126.1 hypothetical protein BDZ99DRAFT_459840 [Mytilinidion resinicola]
MATQAHCAYCFETLAASLERRQPLDLAQVEALWNRYNDGPEDAEEEDAEDEDEATLDNSHRPAAICRLIAPSPATSSSSSVPSTASTSSVPSEASSATSKSSSGSSFFSLGRRAKGEANPAPSTIEKSPLFVTWNTVLGSETSLRGCIGTFEPHELDDGLRSYALTSAFGDHRFDRIDSSELPSLECGVTLLTNFEDAPDPMAWDIGKHGLRISFKYNGETLSSTYLPDVAREQDWTKENTLISLMRKAGWGGRRDQWTAVKLKVVRYQGQQVKLRYPEWKEWSDWVNKQDVL